MLSTKTLATLLLFTLNMQLAASSGTQEPSPSSKSSPTKKRVRKLKMSRTAPMLVDTEYTTNPVEAQGESTEVIGTLQEQPVPQVNNQFEELIEQEKYDDIERYGRSMSDDMFLEEICPVVKTFEQYNEIVEYLKKHKMVASFYVYGDIGVVRGVIIANSSIYNEQSYFRGGDLEAALPLALNNDCHDRVIELLSVRQKMTAEKDKQRKQMGIPTSFELFVNHFLNYLAPWEDDMALRRFLAHCEGEFRTKHSNILDALCQKLVSRLSTRLDKPKAVNLLVDMIGQPSLLTPVSFANGFLRVANDEHLSVFIKYGWAEALQEGLKVEYPFGGKELWREMKKKRSDQLTEKFPETEEERAIACKQFPTKQQKEEEWASKNATILLTKLRNLPFTRDLILDDFCRTVAEYAISMADIDSAVFRSELI